MKRGTEAAAFLLVSIVLSGCAGESTPEVTPAPESEATQSETEQAPEESEAEPTEEPSASTTGTREAPLALGEARQISEESAWTVSVDSVNLDAAEDIRANSEWAPEPADGEVFVVATVTATVDADSISAQDIDLANEGVDPAASIFVEFVTGSGRGYDGSSGSGCYTDNMLYEQGNVYEDGASATGDFCIAVPADEVEGGLWRLSNLVNDSVWVAASRAD